MAPEADTSRAPAAFLLFLTAATAVASWLHLRLPNVPDPDSLYHIQHAALYRANGPFMTGFPWITCSVFDRFASDIWYGFHLLLLPFTVIGDTVLRIKVPGILLTVALLVMVRAAARRLGLTRAWLWPFVLLVVGPNVLVHMTLMRPHVLSTGLAALLFAFLVDGNLPGIFLSSLGIACFHLSFFWVIPGIVLAILVSRWLTSGRLAAPADGERPAAAERGAGRVTSIAATAGPLGRLSGLTDLVAAVAGLAAGWLLRPNPLGAARIVRVQIVDLIVEKQSGVPLTFARELYPITGPVIAENFIPFLLLWGCAIGLALLAHRKRALSAVPPRLRIAMGASLLLSGGFFAMMLFVARRSFDLWSVFAVLFVAIVDTSLVARAPTGEGARRAPSLVARREPGTSPGGAGIAGRGEALLRAGPRAWLIGSASALLILMAVWGVVRSGWTIAGSLRPGDYREAAGWLASHSRPGEIVYNVHWDAFPRLFVWNQTNRYVSGMDPVFEYAYDRVLYWRSHYLQTGAATRETCGDPACRPDSKKDTFRTLADDFHARWLFIEKDRSPDLLAWVRTDPRFRLAFENEKQAIFDLAGVPEEHRDAGGA